MLTPEGIEVTPEEPQLGAATWMRAWVAAFGLWLGVLWLVATLYRGGPSWLRWVDLGLAALSGCFALWPGRGTRLLPASPFVLTALLTAAWVVALATGGAGWLAWWTFAFALGYFLLGAAASTWRGYGPYYGQTWKQPPGYMGEAHRSPTPRHGGLFDRGSRALSEWM